MHRHLAGGSAHAQAWWDSIQIGEPPEIQHGFLPEPSIATSLPNNGDPAGFRKWLGERGVVYGLEYTNDVLSNVRGGSKTGTIDQGKLHGILTVDFGKLAGWQGPDAVRQYLPDPQHRPHPPRLCRRHQHHRGDRSGADHAAFGAVARAEFRRRQGQPEGRPARRRHRVLLQRTQHHVPAERLADHCGGESAERRRGLSAVHARRPPQGRPDKNVSLLLAVLNGDPAGPGPGDEQFRNRYGLNFRVSDPPFMIGEAQFQRNHGQEGRGLGHDAEARRLGALRAVQRPALCHRRRLLADPAGSGVPLKHRGNNGLYAVIDQQLYRPKGGDSHSGISVFSRMSISPSDRNLIDALYRRRHRVRRHDPAAARRQVRRERHLRQFSDSVRAFDRDTVAVHRRAGPDPRLRDQSRTHLLAQIVPGWTVQPNLQFIWHPNGDASRNATVVGVRSHVAVLRFLHRDPRPAVRHQPLLRQEAAPCSPSCASRCTQ